MALLVLYAHSPELIDGNRSREFLTIVFGSISSGDLAVDVFFLLSGYLIMQSWDEQPDAWIFLKKRVLRIYPAFLVASVVCAVIVGPLAADPFSYFASFNISAFLAGAFLLKPPVIPPVFQGLPYAEMNTSMWTIAREFECYLLVLGAGMLGLLRKRHFWLILTAVALASAIALKLAHVRLNDLRLATFFCSGACFYIYRSKIPLRGLPALACLGLTCLSMVSWRASEIALATLGAYTIFYLATKPSVFFNKFNRFPDFSYGLYLYAWPVQQFIVSRVPGITPSGLFATSAAVAFCAGILSWYAIEKPALKLKRVRIPTKELA